MMFTAAVTKLVYITVLTMNGEKGFTYIFALMLIFVTGISLMVAQKQWRTIMQREHEIELLFRGEQILTAIESFYQNSPGESKIYPRSFKVLLKDNRFPNLKRHLRKLYKDPMTSDGNWGIIYDGNGRIKGVYSTSGAPPLKQSGFPKRFKSFENKKKYNQWKFVHARVKEVAS
jgi:type II secretory pathway pseudopilin PulG